MRMVYFKQRSLLQGPATPGSSWFFCHTVLILGGGRKRLRSGASKQKEQEEGARHRVFIRSRESLRVWAPWCETPTQPWGCTDSLFILGSLRPALAALSLKDKNSCFVSCTDNKGPQIGRGLSLSTFSFFFFSRNYVVIPRISKPTHGTRKRMATSRGPHCTFILFCIQQLWQTSTFTVLSLVDRIHINSNRPKVFVENESPAAAAGFERWTTTGIN